MRPTLPPFLRDQIKRTVVPRYDVGEPVTLVEGVVYMNCPEARRGVILGLAGPGGYFVRLHDPNHSAGFTVRANHDNLIPRRT